MKLFLGQSSIQILEELELKTLDLEGHYGAEKIVKKV